MKRLKFFPAVIGVIIVLIGSAFWIGNLYWKSTFVELGHLVQIGVGYHSPVEEIPEDELTVPDLILLGARAEVNGKTCYDASYVSISYPGGDVSSDVGACTDVVIRAFRNAGIDLQELIHEDMKENFNLYPKNWGLNTPDHNIDHRRVPNQICFLERYGTSLSTEVEGNLEQWQWGDVVYWRFSNGRDHCGIVSDLTRKDGIPLVIHNASITREEDCLLKWEIIGHFRFYLQPSKPL